MLTSITFSVTAAWLIQCIDNTCNAAKHYAFDTLTTTFNFGGIPHSEIIRSMRLFAKEVLPAFR